MKALQYVAPRDVRYGDMPDPRIEDARDIVVKIDRCGICGSDLHIYHGDKLRDDAGFCIGHEAIGEVVETGRAVTRLKAGDRVLIPASVGCGACVHCLAGNVLKCSNDVEYCYGLSSRLQGCQAEGMRVPAGDFNAVPMPEGITPDQAIMLTDNLPTAWFGCRNADIAPGGTVAIVGLGSIGLMAVEAAFVLGAATVFAIDLVAERRAVAASLGAIALGPEDAADVIRDATDGRMADSVVEAVGLEKTIALAVRLAGKQASVSIIGVNMNRRMEFPMARVFVNGLTLRSGMCPVARQFGELVPLIQQGRLHPERFVTDVLPLSQGAQAYARFDAREEGTLKMILVP
ncbi:alcohol dehydrogenase [Sphingomonas ginsenosidimutans]|jgi:threonine dehydrogenase-like Zn-dependent dehydrogenase|uniref:Alcohol dehydrogenase n=1 Tax=Sphingomonas ginsenosidimutans TaxID=862134 RepID=A0A2A4I2L0_9SPHN|nr:alcohol dehydrogenase catalytic domain-containing protein [Sphingomonas ginsenosidimutans]PCG10419.1 alcohol dehydrogenase [Sphingomonas ginsenosidimutans]